MKRRFIACSLLSLALTAMAGAQEKKPATPAPAAGGEKAAAGKVRVELDTSMGKIVLELDEKKAPITVANFKKYVESGHYNGTIFHRVIDGFMIQGGAFAQKGDKAEQKKSNAPIKNEAKKSGLKNARGTIAMARTNNPDSATAQFFINVKDNNSLNPGGMGPGSAGYAVFGKVVEGMDVVDKIKAVPTKRRVLTVRLPDGSTRDAPMGDVPIKDVVLKTAKIVGGSTEKKDK